jgi:Family of unknown function (DUF5681)
MPGDYRIGYKRPPKSTQFRKGQSGNPRGRPKTRSLKSDLAKELMRPIRILVNGRKTTVSTQQAVLIAVTEKAMKGDPRSAAVIFNLVKQMLESDADENQLDAQLSSADKEIIQAFLQRQLRNRKPGSSK